MSRNFQKPSMIELCEIFQRRNRHIFGERTLPGQQEPPKNASTPSLKKGNENPLSSNSSKTHSTDQLPPVNERQIQQSRSRRKVVRVAPPQQVKQNDVPCHRAKQRQVSQCTNPQAKQRIPRQAARETTKPSIACQNVAEKETERGGGRTTLKNDTTIHRPCLPHPALSVPGTGRSKTTARSGTSSRQTASSNKPSRQKHQSATKQQQKGRDDQMKPRSRRVGAMNPVMPERRVAFHQETNELQHCTDRRIGLCTQTDPAQQHLTFIRVLRKRF